MNRIRLLPEQVANQIAAGEVIERPASVVKELVENALDAKASRITVEVQAGGRSLMRVTDDGIGMSRDDALLCLERHATSKIQTAHDLSVIRTMGFRGEAVPSIASVSRMTLTTREREGSSEAGCQVIIHGGRMIEVKEAGCAPGTSVEVRNLFFNLPARRKFLRTEETERAHIQHYLSLAALAYPEVAFTFVEEQRVVWQLPPALTEQARAGELPALKERLRGLYGSELDMLAVDFSFPGDAADGQELDGVPVAGRIWGFIGAPGTSRATRDEQHLFVNKRPVENRGLNFALLEGYHTALMKGRYPVCCLFIEIDPAAVDVNIHPAKREVKFHQEWLVRRAVSQAVREALLAFHTKSSGQTGAQIGLAIPAKAPAIEAAPVPPDGPSREQSLPNLAIAGVRSVEPVAASAALPAPAPNAPVPAPETKIPDHATPAAAPLDRASSAPAIKTAAAAEPVPLLHVPLRVLGVVGQLYVVMESDRGLVLMDQHAAHERVLFEQMLRRMEQGQAPSQRLLLPETIELSPRDAQFLREQLPTLSRLGVGLSEFGERTFLLDALPPFVKAPNGRQFVVELVDGLKAAGEDVNAWRLGEQMVAKTVCRHAIKANDPLTGPELENLINDLRQCTMPYTCPHGRPTLIEMSYRELEKKFGRAPLAG